MERKVNVLEDLEGNKIVFIHDVIFKGKRSIEWSDVEMYLKQFVGESYVIDDTNDMIYIGAGFPELQPERNTEKTQKRNIVKMQNLDGIDMILDLHCQYVMITAK